MRKNAAENLQTRAEEVRARAAAPARHPLATLAERRAVLDPARLGSTAEAAARALLRQGESTNTRLSYGSAMRYWCAWYAARYGGALAVPVPVPVVVQFIVDHAARRPDEEEQDPQGAPGRKKRPAALVTELPPDVDEALVSSGYKGKPGPPALNTLVHRIAVLSKAHQMAGANTAGADIANPCADPLVRELLARTRRAYAQRGARAKRQRALTKDPLQQLLATCDDSLKGRRDRALLLFAWATGGRRRSEVASATLENLQRVDAEAFVYTLAHSKTNQRGDLRPEDVKPLVGSAAAAMREWLAVLQAHGIREGAIFRRIRRGGHLAEPLAPAAVRDIVKARCALAGVEGSFSAHSLRAGFVTEAGRQNMPLPETMAMTGHQSVATVVGYFRAESALAGRAGRLFDEE
jgi:integrase